MEKSRKFSVHPQMIYSLITAQAGTLGKAVLENIMNSIDAEASKVTIDITRDKIVIVDDGHGFRSEQEIEDCFEVFGFPHEAGSRIYGQFGIGRAQLWSFSSAVWRTNTFLMDVDIKKRGLDYHLKENQPQVNGLTIESTFYKPMSTQDVQVFKQELKELALYAQIPVILDGEQINKDPTAVKWDFETDDAWIKVSDSASLTVYNLGVLVRKYSAYQVGSGGLVVTKPGVKLSLNMARNDILLSECKVWGRIKPFIQKKSDEKVRRKATKLTSEELENQALRFLSGEIGYKDIAEFKLITDIAGRGYTLQAFMSQDRGTVSNRIVSIAEEGSRVGERAHSTGLVFVLHPEVLRRFGVESFDDFKPALFKALDRHDAEFGWWYSTFKRDAIFHASLNKAVPALTDGYQILPDKEWTKQESGVLIALGRIECDLRARIYQVGASDCRLARRDLRVGISDTALAWTDASSVIVFDRNFLKVAQSGIGGFMHLVSAVAHEYLHDSSSVGTHMHDETFYKRFHDVHNHPEVGNLAFAGYRAYVSYILNAGIAPTKKLLETLTFAEELDAREPRVVKRREMSLA